MSDNDRVKRNLIVKILHEARKIQTLGGGKIAFTPSCYEWDAQAERWYDGVEWVSGKEIEKS